MKKIVLGTLVIVLMAACSTPPTPKVQADAAALAKTFPEGSGTWHLADTRWDNGIHFCVYQNGRDKIFSRIETYESCPAQIGANKQN